MPLNVAILGASGTVGRLVVSRLLSYPDDVVGRVELINRRLLDDDTFPTDARLVSHVVDMSSGDALAATCEPILRETNVVISTMGIGSGKGSLEEFRKVEVELPSAFARAAGRVGVQRALLLTAVGSNIETTSFWPLFFVADGQYFHLKGLLEKKFSHVGFGGGLAIFRPSVLLGTEARLGGPSPFSLHSY
jgi:nucleoside-diphosphate-sugar epimerase